MTEDDIAPGDLIRSTYGGLPALYHVIASPKTFEGARAAYCLVNHKGGYVLRWWRLDFLCTGRRLFHADDGR